MPNEVTRQGVRNLDLMKRKVEVAPCQMVDGKYVGGMLSKWKKEGIYPNAAMERLDEPDPAWRNGDGRCGKNPARKRRQVRLSKDVVVADDAPDSGCRVAGKGRTP